MDLVGARFAVGATLLAGLLFGFLPSYISAHSRISETLRKEDAAPPPQTAAPRGRQRLRGSAVGLALVLLTGSGLLIRSFVRLIGVDPGFDTGHLLTFKIALPALNTVPTHCAWHFSGSFLTESAPSPASAPPAWKNYPPLAGLGAATACIFSASRLLRSPIFPWQCRRRRAGLFRHHEYSPARRPPFQRAELAEEKHVTIINQAFEDKYLHGV